MIDREILKKIRHIEIHSRKLVNEVFSGEYHSVFKGSGINFSEVREYHHGDDTRFIDWNVTARTGKPYLKIFEEERQLNVALMIDASASNFFSTALKSKLEIAAELSAIIAFSALQNNDKVGIILFTDIIEKYLPPKRGRKYSLRIIRELLTFKPERVKTDISKALEFAIKTFKRKSVIFLISDFFDSNFEKQLAALAKKHDLTNIVITDIRDLMLDACGILNLRDSETGAAVYLDSSDKSIRAKFEADNKQRLDNLKKMFNKYDIDSIKLSSDKSYIEPLIAYFKKRIKNINKLG